MRVRISNEHIAGAGFIEVTHSPRGTRLKACILPCFGGVFLSRKGTESRTSVTRRPTLADYRASEGTPRWYRHRTARASLLPRGNKQQGRFGGEALPGLPHSNGNKLSVPAVPKALERKENAMPRLMIIAALVGSFALAACNTTAGAGKDMQSAGKAIESTANDAKN